MIQQQSGGQSIIMQQININKHTNVQHRKMNIIHNKGGQSIMHIMNIIHITTQNKGGQSINRQHIKKIIMLVTQHTEQTHIDESIQQQTIK